MKRFLLFLIIVAVLTAACGKKAPPRPIEKGETSQDGGSDK